MGNFMMDKIVNKLGNISINFEGGNLKRIDWKKNIGFSGNFQWNTHARESKKWTDSLPLYVRFLKGAKGEG